MKGQDVTAIREAYGYTNKEMIKVLGISERKLTTLQSSKEDISLMDELAIRGLFFKTKGKKITLKAFYDDGSDYVIEGRKDG